MNGDNFIYRGKMYDYYSFLIEAKNIKKASFLILNQEVYIRKIKVDLNKLSEDDINEIKEMEFGREEEYLIHYELNKEEKGIYMYAVSGGDKLGKLAMYFKELSVNPIQFQVRKALKKKIKESNYQCLFLYDKTYYYINISNKLITQCHLWKSSSEVEAFLKKLECKDTFYVDKNLAVDFPKNIFIDLGDIYNEKILFK